VLRQGPGERKVKLGIVSRLSRKTNRAITTAQVVEELIGLARTIREAVHRGEESGLTEAEVAFYDALADNASAREVMQD
jgi:type I restriction enzyme R subunit